MSRSNPSANNPNPSTKWFQWKGKEGKLVWYDKDQKENVEMSNGFRFLVLDQLSTVTGYNKKAKSGIKSNEVRDVADVMVVKYFSGDTIAEGPWSAIKKDVTYEKGKFAKSVYIAFKDGDELKIGNILMTGSALGPWFEFTKAVGKSLDSKAVTIKAGAKDTTGDVEFVPPAFSLVDTTEETNEAAVALDKELQAFLKSYLAKTKHEQAEGHPAPPADESPYSRENPAMTSQDDEDPDSIPF